MKVAAMFFRQHKKTTKALLIVLIAIAFIGELYIIVVPHISWLSYLPGIVAIFALLFVLWISEVTGYQD